MSDKLPVQALANSDVSLYSLLRVMRNTGMNCSVVNAATGKPLQHGTANTLLRKSVYDDVSGCRTLDMPVRVLTLKHVGNVAALVIGVDAEKTCHGNIKSLCLFNVLNLISMETPVQVVKHVTRDKETLVASGYGEQLRLECKHSLDYTVKELYCACSSALHLYIRIVL